MIYADRNQHVGVSRSVKKVCLFRRRDCEVKEGEKGLRLEAPGYLRSAC
jgi:hypothetical protein